MLGLPQVSQTHFNTIMRNQFPNVTITKNKLFARCNVHVSITNKLRATTNSVKVEQLCAFQTVDNNYITSCHGVYYAHRLNS